MGTSLYPNQIDNSTSIPVATDGITPVNAEAVNRLRDAIIAIESENGVNPSGTYGTVRARLDALEAGGGGGGGGSPLEIQDNGTSVDTSVTTINFIGTTITNPSSGVVDVTISGTNVTQVQETIPVISPGQTSFTLSQIPIQASAVQMFLNGIKLEEGTEYSNTPLTTTVTYTGLVTTNITDVVEFWYLVEIGMVVPGSNLQVQEGGVTVESSTNSINFTGNVNVTSISSGSVQVDIPTPALIVEDNGSPLDSNVSIINFTGNVSLTNPASGTVDVDIPTYSLEVQNNGSTVESNTLIINAVGKISSSLTVPGSVNLEVPESKIRVYLDSSNFSGAASGMDQTIIWNATSSKVTTTNASLSGGTQLIPTKSGLYLIQGQLTIQPTVDSISSIIIKVIHNGTTTVHTLYDAGSVWSVGTNRSFNFNFPMELTSLDALEVSWQHVGSALSSTDLVFGDDLSWFSLFLI